MTNAPYAGIKILDFTKTIAGPYASMILASLGAEIIKIEHPIGGDDTRRFAPSWNDESVSFLAFNRNKKSVAIDIKSPEGREAVLRLGAQSDVVMESFKAGTMDRLGLSFDAFRNRNPHVIYCSVSAFGRGERGKFMPGYDPLLQAFSGIMKGTGHPGSPPVRAAPSLVDLTTGMWTAMTIMASLASRGPDSEARQLEVTLVDSAINLMCHQVLGVLATGIAPEPQGSGSPLSAPYEVFDTRDGELMIAAGNDALFKKLCKTIDLERLIEDARFATTHQRVVNRPALHDYINRMLIERDSDHWIATFTKAGIPAGPVQDLKQAIEHPLIKERGLLLAPPPGSRIDGIHHLRLPLEDSTPPLNDPPSLGAHTREVLAQAGFSENEISQLLHNSETAA